jgi:hypothetical protein
VGAPPKKGTSGSPPGRAPFSPHSDLRRFWAYFVSPHYPELSEWDQLEAATRARSTAASNPWISLMRSCERSILPWCRPAFSGSLWFKATSRCCCSVSISDSSMLISRTKPLTDISIFANSIATSRLWARSALSFAAFATSFAERASAAAIREVRTATTTAKIVASATTRFTPKFHQSEAASGWNGLHICITGSPYCEGGLPFRSDLLAQWKVPRSGPTAGHFEVADFRHDPFHCR